MHNEEEKTPRRQMHSWYQGSEKPKDFKKAI